MVPANDATPRFFGYFADLATWPVPRNLLRLMIGTAGLRPFVVDGPANSYLLIARGHRGAQGQVMTQALDKS